MSRDPLRDLAALTAAVRTAAEAKMRRLAAQEAELREELAALEAKCRAARHLDAGDLMAQQSIGADMLWQGWVNRTRRQLQIRLARVLAMKGAALQELRRAHGRSEAAETLVGQATKTARSDLEKRQIRQEQSLVLLDEARRRAASG